MLDVKDLLEYKCNYERVCSHDVDGNISQIAEKMGKLWMPSKCPLKIKRFLMVDYTCQSTKEFLFFDVFKSLNLI